MPTSGAEPIRRLVLDTSAYSRFRAGHPTVLDLLANADVVMLPVTVGTILTVGTMGIIGLRFNFFNVAGIALIFGFGVDYGIYLVQAHIEEGSLAGSNAVRSVGGSIVLCAVTTLVGCGSLIATHYRGLASIGTVLCLGAVFCLASTILLLPALLTSKWNAGNPS